MAKNIYCFVYLFLKKSQKKSEWVDPNLACQKSVKQAKKKICFEKSLFFPAGFRISSAESTFIQSFKKLIFKFLFPTPANSNLDRLSIFWLRIFGKIFILFLSGVVPYTVIISKIRPKYFSWLKFIFDFWQKKISFSLKFWFLNKKC